MPVCDATVQKSIGAQSPNSEVELSFLGHSDRFSVFLDSERSAG